MPKGKGTYGKKIGRPKKKKAKKKWKDLTIGVNFVKENLKK